MDDRARSRLQIKLVLVIWRREIRRLADSNLAADERAARESELRDRTREVLRVAADHIHVGGDDPTDLAELARALREVDDEH